MTTGQLATVGFAGAGFFLGGSTGMAVGWMVGSWLFSESMDQGNEIFDPGAQELPGFNQALRGVTLPILFGTNRVECQHTWRKNFESIRSESDSESGAGGKTGGSGGGGKGGAAGGAGSVSYTYKLDVMYHLGMTTEEFFLYGGWIGSQRLNDQTILAIGQGFGSNAVLFGTSSTVPKEASLEYEEAYYYPGSDQNPGWTYFLEQENVPVTSSDTGSLGFRWKNTVWVGFKGLDLGPSPQTPLVQFEVGPGGGVLDLDDNFVGQDNHGSTLSPDAMGTTLSANGKWLSGCRGATVDAMFIDAPNATSLTRYQTDIGVFVTTAMQNASIDHGFTFAIQDWAMIIPGTNFLLLSALDIDIGTRANHGWIIIDLDQVPDGTNPLQQQFVAGTIFRRGNALQHQNLTVHGVYQYDLQTEGDDCFVVYHNQVGANLSTMIILIGSITEFKANTDFGTGDTMGAVDFLIDGVWGDDFPGVSGHADHNSQFFFAVPYVDGSANLGTYLYAFIPRETARTSSNTRIVTEAATYPNGFFLRLDMGILDDPSLSIDDGVDNAFLKDSTGTSTVSPFADDGKGIGDSDQTNDDAEYRPEVHAHQWKGNEAAGGTLLLFHKIYYGATQGAPFGINIGVRAFIWNPVSKTAIQVADQHNAAPLFDTVDDAGQTEDDRFNWQIKRSMLSYSEDTQEVIHLGAFDTISGTDPLKDEYVVSMMGNLTIGGQGDVTPPFIIRQIISNEVYGMGFDESLIDETTYAIAVQYCESEGILVSTKYRREENWLKVIDQLLSLYNGYIIRRGENFIFGLMDFGQDSGAVVVRTLDNDHFVVENGQPPVRVTEGAAKDTYNRVKVNFLDRSLEYRQNFVEENDEVDQDFNGIRAKEFAAQFVMSEALARKLAIRGLWSNLYARDRYAFSVSWKDMDLEPGDLVTLVDSFDPKLSGGVRVRITELVEKRPGLWAAQAMQEIESIVTAPGQVNSATNQSSGGFLRGPTGAAHLFAAYELPKEFQGANPKVFFGWAQSERTMGAKLWLSGDGITFTQASDVTPNTVSGIFAGGLPARPRGYVEQNIEVYLFPDVRSASFDPNSPAYVDKFTFEDGGETQRSLGGTAIWVGSEMVAYQAPTIIGSNHYRFKKVYRGWGGTPIQDHSSGDFWWRHGGGVFVQPINEDKVGTIIHYKVTPYNFSGFVWPVESVDARTYTIRGTYFNPQIAGNMRIIVGSEDFTQTTRRALSDITSQHFAADWSDSARCEGWGALGYGFSGYGHFATDPASHQWRVEVVGSGGTIVHSTVVTTTTFTYSAGQNLSDNTTFRNNVAFRITPFSTFGDALVTQVVSLEFFGV